MGPVLAQRRKRSRRSIERPARRGGSERARPAVPSVNVALASSEAQPDVVLDTRYHPRRSRSLDHDAPCCPDCVGAGRPLSVHRRSIARSFSRDDVDWIVLASEQTARAKLLLELWFGNGRLPDIVEAGILRPARCTRGSRRCLNGWQKT